MSPRRKQSTKDLGALLNQTVPVLDDEPQSAPDSDLSPHTDYAPSAEPIEATQGAASPVDDVSVDAVNTEQPGVVIEEKSSRVIEVLLSAVTPFQLMAGKILGLAGVGFTIVGLWGAGAYFAATKQGLSLDVTTEMMLYLIVYYILGFLLLSAVFAGVGSICNTIKETQGLMMPIIMILIVPLMSWFPLAQNPDGTLARVLSFVPPLTPMLMVLRLSAGSDVSMVEILASIAVLAAATVATMWMAAKVFRTGILMYGKRPALREVFRWLRQK